MAETLVLLFVLFESPAIELLPRVETIGAYENALVSVRVVNTSAQRVTYPTARPMVDFRLGVRHADRRPLALTAIGERDLRPFTSRWSPLKWGDEWPLPVRDPRPMTLEPGEERIHDVWLGQWLEFERPGRYTVFIRGAAADAPVVVLDVAPGWDKPASPEPRENDAERRRRLALEALGRSPADAASYEALRSVVAHAVEHGGPDAGGAAFEAWARRVGTTPEVLAAWQRQWAKDIIALGMTKRAEARPLLRRALRSPNAWVVRAAARALSLLGSADDAVEVARAVSSVKGAWADAVFWASDDFLRALERVAGGADGWREAMAERARLRAVDAALGGAWGAGR